MSQSGEGIPRREKPARVGTAEGWLEQLVNNAHTTARVVPEGATWTRTEPPSPENGWNGATGEGNSPLLIG